MNQIKRNVFKRIFSGWNLLLFAGAGFIPGGILMILLTWHPKPGPYKIGERYPYGNYLQVWQVSMGFAFLAFGVLYVGAILARRKLKSRTLWFALLLSYVLFWFPHFWIGVKFFFYEFSLSNIGLWAKYYPFIFAWMIILGVGFYLAWK